jgi:hypothetical protein
MRNLLILMALAFATALEAQEPLKLKVDLVEITATEKVYNFTTEDFVGIIGWQFKMKFDGTKMKFKEIRNPILPSQTTSNFFEPNPGELRSVWLDPDLAADDYPDSTVLFQMVFEILETEGAPLCFLDAEEYFEFIMDEGSGSITLAEILISDDCYQGFSIILDPTATENPKAPDAEPVKDLFLSSNGTFAFTSSLTQPLTITLSDMTGNIISSLGKREYTLGRHTVNCKTLIPGMYIVKVVRERGEETVIKVLAY